MSENLEVVKVGYAAFSRGDLDAAFAALDLDCVIRAGTGMIPAGGDYHGKREIFGRWLPELIANYEDLRFLADSWIDARETIVVTGTLRTRLRGTAEEIKAPFCHVWRFREGKVVEARLFTDTAVTLQAVQLRDGPVISRV